MEAGEKNLEPKLDKCSLVKPRDIDLAIIPALCADKKGNRIGYGLGFYDKLLENMPKAYTICPIYQEQMSPQLLTHEEHDIPMHEVKAV